MNKDQINQAIAKALGRDEMYVMVKHGLYYRPNSCGYTGNLFEAGLYTPEEAKKQESSKGYPDEVKKVLAPVPNYYEDLNLCAEFRKSVPKNLRLRYSNSLRDIITEKNGGWTYDYEVIDASAPQHCEAFLRTLNLWKDE